MSSDSWDIFPRAGRIVGFVCLFILVACSRNNDPISPFAGNGTAGPLGIEIDRSVPADQRDYLVGDLEMLKSVSLAATNSQYVQYIGVNDFSNDSLTTWLQARVKLIVGETFDYDSASSPVEQRPYNPQLLSEDYNAVGKIQTVMFNLGAYIYLNGKSSSTVYSLQLGTGMFPVKSPRVGVIQIGEGLFQANAIKSSPFDSMANRFLRAAVFFHEARHTDGNGKNAAFPHAKCTTGDYAGNNACEANLNGPYIVEAIILREFYDSCSSCTTKEADSLRAFIADNVSRLQQGAQMQDARPEAIP